METNCMLRGWGPAAGGAARAWVAGAPRGGCQVAGGGGSSAWPSSRGAGRASLAAGFPTSFHCTSQVLLLFCSHVTLFQASLATSSLLWANCVRNRFLVFVFLCRHRGFLATEPTTSWGASVATCWPLSWELRGDIRWDTSCLPSSNCHELEGAALGSQAAWASGERPPHSSPHPPAPGPGPRLHTAVRRPWQALRCSSPCIEKKV